MNEEEYDDNGEYYYRFGNLVHIDDIDETNHTLPSNEINVCIKLRNREIFISGKYGNNIFI